MAVAAETDPFGAGMPGWVEDDFRAYLRCGILAHGFARIRCDACAAERVVAFACKAAASAPPATRAVMVEVAARADLFKPVSLTGHRPPACRTCRLDFQATSGYAGQLIHFVSHAQQIAGIGPDPVASPSSI